MHRAAYLDAAAIAADLLDQPAVADRWREPSALPEFAVSGLAGHLGRQLTQVVDVLAGDATGRATVPLAEHYGRSAWLGKDVDEPVNVTIRTQGEESAAGGPAALRETVRAALDALRAALPAEPADRAVLLPWTGWALTLDDFLVTRMMEIAVHSDDLAVSVGVPTPAFPEPVLGPVLALLTDLAVRRHGQTAVLRALSRRERAPQTITAL